jgi:hypothetical protein
MNSSLLNEQVQLFKSVFKGREDVFAIMTTQKKERDLLFGKTH